jgi:serine/threonine-protein phosphatase 2A regulatory subunit A
MMQDGPDLMPRPVGPARILTTVTSNAPTLQEISKLIDEMNANDLPTRTNAFRHLEVISRFLGPERTRAELIPYINEFTDENEAILLPIVEGLHNLIECVGGSEHAHVIFLPLEALCNADDVQIREQVRLK